MEVWLALAFFSTPADNALQEKYLSWQGWVVICEKEGEQSDETYLGEMWFLQGPDDWTHFGRGQKTTVTGRLSCPGCVCIMPDDLHCWPPITITWTSKCTLLLPNYRDLASFCLYSYNFMTSSRTKTSSVTAQRKSTHVSKTEWKSSKSIPEQLWTSFVV